MGTPTLVSCCSAALYGDAALQRVLAPAQMSPRNFTPRGIEAAFAMIIKFVSYATSSLSYQLVNIVQQKLKKAVLMKSIPPKLRVCCDAFFLFINNFTLLLNKGFSPMKHRSKHLF